MTPQPAHVGRLSGPVALTPRQRELAGALAALLVADYKAFPPLSDKSPGGNVRASGESSEAR